MWVCVVYVCVCVLQVNAAFDFFRKKEKARAFGNAGKADQQNSSSLPSLSSSFSFWGLLTCPRRCPCRSCS